MRRFFLTGAGSPAARVWWLVAMGTYTIGGRRGGGGASVGSAGSAGGGADGAGGGAAVLSAALAGQHGCHVLTGPGRTEGRRPMRTGLRTGLLAGLSPGLLSRGGSRSRGPPYVGGGGGGNDRILNVRKGGVWCCSALYEQQWRFVMYFCVFFLYIRG